MFDGRFARYWFFFLVFTIGSTLSLNPTFAQTNRQEPNAPFTILFDTGTPLTSSLTAELLVGNRWTRIPEDKTNHRFQGDAVFLNDKIAVVLRNPGDGAEIYTRAGTVPQFRAKISPRPAADLRTISIVENNPGAVQLDVQYQYGNKNLALGYRLTTGESNLEIHPGAGAENLSIKTKPEYIIVPDFFGDDMVFSAGSVDGNYLYLPTEKFLLGALAGGNALMMCIWESNDLDARIHCSGNGSEKAITGLEIQCLRDKKIWIAWLESPKIWRHVSPKNQTPSMAESPPFSAKWRMNILKNQGEAQSLPYSDESVNELKDAECLVYPIDRDLSTPLSILCPIDIMKNTLGVGPCQYILEVEKLGSDTHPTPEQVTEWVEKQFARKKEKRDPQQMKENLEAMLALLRQSRARIQEYGDFAESLLDLCEKTAQAKPNLAAAINPLRPLFENLSSVIAARSDAMKTPDDAIQLTNRILDLVGTDNSLPQCRSLCSQIRSIGGTQDYLLSKCRMTARWVRQQCRMLSVLHPQAVEFLTEAQKRAEKMLKEKG